MSTRKNVHPFKLHASEKCDCYQDSVREQDKTCVYQQFPDGWDFTPDAGRSKSHAEVFTPLWIVKKMINDTGVIPTEILYPEDYPNYHAKDSLLPTLDHTILDMACGTGNYYSTVLYYKLSLAKHVYENNKSIDFDTLVLRAVSSVYGFDIDYGNANTLYHRVFDDDKSNDVPRLLESTLPLFDSPVNVKDLTHAITCSITNAEENFGGSPSGLIQRYYTMVTGQTLPPSLSEKIREVLSKNILVFNGISLVDDLTSMVPSRCKVVWFFWNVEQESFEKIPLMCQVLEPEIEKIRKELKELEETHANKTSTDLFGLFGESIVSPLDFTHDVEAGKEYKRLSKELNKLMRDYDFYSQLIK